MTTSITKRVATALLTRTTETAWAVIGVGERGAERLFMAEQCPPTLVRFFTALQATGEALEALVETTGRRLGIDMADVLEPAIASRVG
jgi:hypothetical protein